MSASRTGRLYPQECSWYSYSLGAESTPGPWVQSEGNVSLKNPVTPPGIDPGTVRLVAQHLNRYATPGPTHNQVPCIIISEVTPRSHSRNPDYCLLSEYWNPVLKNLLQTSVCCKSDPPQPTPPPPNKTGSAGPLSMPMMSMPHCHIS